MFIRKNSLFVGVLLLCVVGTGIFCLAAGAGESGGKKGKDEIKWLRINPPNYHNGDDFSERWAWVQEKEDGPWSLLDDDPGKVEIKWLYPPKYHDGNPFLEERAWVQEEEDGPWSLLDDQGNILKTGLKASRVFWYNDGIAAFSPPRPAGNSKSLNSYGYKAGLLNRSGDVLRSPVVHDLEFCYDDPGGVQEGLLSMRWGFIDTTGTPASDFKFDDARSFSPEMAPVWVDARWGITDPTWRRIDRSEPTLIALEKDGKIGFINSKGDVVIDFQYPPATDKTNFPIYCFNYGHAIVILDDSNENNIEYGIIDEYGKVLFRRKNCEFFLLGQHILCLNKNGRYSLISRGDRGYDRPDDLLFLNKWVTLDEKSPYPFMGVRDGKIGYFTIALKRN